MRRTSASSSSAVSGENSHRFGGELPFFAAPTRSDRASQSVSPEVTVTGFGALRGSEGNGSGCG